MAYSVLKEKLIAAVTELEEDEVLKLAEKALREGMEPVELLKTINLGMHNVGKLYEEKTYFIADLIMAGIIFKGVLGLKGMQEVFYSKDQEDRQGCAWYCRR